MTPVKPNPNPGRLATLFFVGCCLLVLYFLFEILRPFFTILIWAAVLTVVFHPLFVRVLVLCRGRRASASLMTCLIVLLMIVIPVVYLAAAIARQSMNLYQSAQHSIGEETGQDRLAQLEQRPAIRWVLGQAERWFGVEEPHLREAIDSSLKATSRFLVSSAPSVIRGAGDFLFSFLLIFISMFFFFRDGPEILKIIRESNPLPRAYEIEILQKFQDVSYAVFFGSILTAIVQGCAGALLFLALRIPSPLFWGSVVAFVSLVPIVGAFLVWLPWSAYLILSGETSRGIALLAIGGLVVSSIDNVLKPIIIRGRTDMHPLLVFLSVLGGMQAFGFIGILLGPLVVALSLSFLDFYRIEFRESLERKLE